MTPSSSHLRAVSRVASSLQEIRCASPIWPLWPQAARLAQRHRKALAPNCCWWRCWRAPISAPRKYQSRQAAVSDRAWNRARHSRRPRGLWRSRRFRSRELRSLRFHSAGMGTVRSGVSPARLLRAGPQTLLKFLNGATSASARRNLAGTMWRRLATCGGHNKSALYCP